MAEKYTEIFKLYIYRLNSYGYLYSDIKQFQNKKNT